ncbi:MAG: hypothetical protein Q4D81_05230 [Eubacteriales bacterium]|nr:hypothetical protein [Eubacteriales bacterium]
MMMREIDPDLLESVSGGSEWIVENNTQDPREAAPGIQNAPAGQDSAGSESGMIGAGFLDRAALQMDRLKGSLTNSAVKKSGS